MALVKVPDGGAWPEVVAFSSTLARLPPSGFYVIDFAEVRFVTPGWMVAIGGALREFRDARPEARRKADNYDGAAMRYAARAGFFRYFGMKYGEETGAAATTDSYLPVTEMSVDDLRGRAAEGMIHHGEVIQADAERMVGVLTRRDAGDVFDTLAYSVRELVRNVVEHSGSDDYAFAAQWWPATNTAELVVSDRGVGLARSLRRNARNQVGDDAAALALATSPGVSSRKPGGGRSNDVWRNTGYGLYMTRGLCSSTGSFTLMSGGKALVADGRGERFLDCDVRGTTVVLRMDLRGAADLTGRLSELRDAAGRGNGRPSVASLSRRVKVGGEAG